MPVAANCGDVEGAVATKSLRPLRRALWCASLVLLGVTSRSTELFAVGAIAEKPLSSAPGAPAGSKLFEQMPVEKTGIVTENRYADPRMWAALYQEFEGGSIGTGIAIGDYDGDGRPDIFVVSKTESCRLFRNLGDFKFEDVTVKAGVADVGAAAAIWKSGVTFVDIDNDGRLDLYVCRFDAPNLLYLNQGDGTFKEQARAYGLDVKDACVMASFADFDRDGWLDVYLATNMLNSAAHPKGQRGYLFHNNRDGTFTNVTEHAGIYGETQSHSATWWDFDNDGWPDLYVANDYGVPDRLYRNNHDGTFTDAIDTALPHTSHFSMGSDLGDVNNDGLIDFLAADMAASSHYKDQHSIAEARGKSEEPPDGVAVAPKYMRSALYLATGTSRCLEAGYLAGIAASDWTWSPRFEDLDDDGHLDLHVTNGFNRDPNPDMHQRSMNAESTAERIKILRNAAVLKETHFAFRNLGDLRFEDVSAAWGLDQTGVSFGSAFGDLDGDGRLDLVYSNYEAGVTVLRNTGSAGHRIMIELRGTLSNRFGVGAVVRLESALGVQARQLTLARGYMSSSEPAVHFGLGADTVIRRLVVTWPSGQVQAFENLGVDRRFIITEPSTPSPALARPSAGVAARQFEEVGEAIGLALASREEPVNEISQQKLLPLRLNRRGPALAIGEVDGSGHASIVIGGTTVQPLRLLHASAGRFGGGDTAAVPVNNEADDGPVLVFDADGDGSNDLLVTKGGNSLPAGVPQYQPHLYLNDGHGAFRSAAAEALPPLPINVGAAVAADFDRDGRLDLFLGGRVLTGQYPETPQSALLVNRGGKFEDVTDALAPGLRDVGMVTAALWTDVDGDGWVDLLVAVEWGGVKYFHNHEGKSFEDLSEKAGFAAAGTGWWTSLAAADFNGDGRMDYVAGNVGLNTPYHADAAHPALLFAGDFKGDGSLQLVEALHEGDRIFPWRSRRGLAAALPAILKRFPLNETYAKATLEQIVGADKLAQAQRLAVTELSSGVFLSQPDGTYRFTAMPRIAQISPLQGVVTGDFDGDGKADIYAVQNSYAPIPSVGRFDGGLSQLLRGDGRGHFTPVPVAESNLLVTGDAKALAMLDWDDDGWADFFVTRNNHTTLAFHNRGVPGHHPLRVTLKGGPGNPDGIGGVVTLELVDGALQTSELHAGSGYYSQSAPACFFGYPDGVAPKAIRVRWPDGRTTTHPVPARASTLTLSPGGS